MSYWTWTDDQGAVHSLDRPTLRVRQMTGYKAAPPLRGTDVVVASYPGQVWLEKQHDARKISLELLIFDQSGGDLTPLLDELAAAFSAHARGTLTLYEDDGTILASAAQVSAYAPAPQTPAAQWWIAMTEFTLADPYLYGPTVTVVTDVSSSPAVQNLIHPGTVRGWKPVFTLTGAATNPEIVNGANGVSVQALVSVPGGQTLIIDCGAWTATLNGSSVIGSIRHAGAFPFMFIEPGSNLLTITGGSTGAALTTVFSPPWL